MELSEERLIEIRSELVLASGDFVGISRDELLALLDEIRDAREYRAFMDELISGEFDDDDDDLESPTACVARIYPDEPDGSLAAMMSY